MVVYRGKGLLALVSIFVALGAAALGLQLAGFDLKQSAVMKGHAWPFTIVLAAAGLFNLIFGVIANRNRAELGIDRSTGMQVRIGVRHSLYFVPIEIWGVAFLAVAVGLTAFMPL